MWLTPTTALPTGVFLIPGSRTHANPQSTWIMQPAEQSGVIMSMASSSMPSLPIAAGPHPSTGITLKILAARVDRILGMELHAPWVAERPP